ncbi:putative mitochondrial protein [Sesamum angolense]|uniref:Mitochondrial protein n=1 Tax=Sesamum angolense TaxID=2727404 RepID=A0AAE1WF30_9LAMI|nr:putative mitochondrial protein [Sesamum angolense]
MEEYVVVVLSAWLLLLINSRRRCSLPLCFKFMDQDIHRMGRALNLSKDEEQGSSSSWVLGMRNLIDKYFFLVGRILSTKPFHPEALKTVLQLAFNPVKGIDFKNPTDIDLNWCEFHVLVQGLPLGKMTQEMAAFVGNKLGRFVDLDTSANGGLWGSSLRICVALDIRQPLRRLLKSELNMLCHTLWDLAEGSPPGPDVGREMIPMLLFGFPPSVVSSARRASPARSVDEDPLALAPPYLASLTTSPNARPEPLSPLIPPTKPNQPPPPSENYLFPLPRTSMNLPTLIRNPIPTADLSQTSPTYRRRLRCSPAGSYEYALLELPRFRGSLGKFRGLENLVCTHHPSLVFLAETKSNNNQIEDKSVSIQLRSFSEHHIDATVLCYDDRDSWRFTGIYGAPKTGNHFQTWSLLSRFSSQSCRPWLCAGLHDLGFVGSPFTWCNNHVAPDTIRVCLDRACGNPLWSQMFPETTVMHLDFVLSDHAPIIISTTGSVIREIKRGPISLESRRKEADLRDKLDACSQRKVNAIDRLRDEGGRWIDDPAALRRLIGRHFSRVFDSDQPSTTEMERGMEHLACRIDYATAQALAQLFTKEEVVRALFQMAPMKSPGPDGMPPLFFQRFWPSIQRDVVPCVLALLNNHVILIPKCRKPESLSQCRPISLCNVLYKIASKSIANRIKPFLETIISPTQAVFVPGQLISDNILVTYELNHCKRNKNWGKMGHMALKLDISKAYDKVEWNFLKHVLLRLGFPPRFVDLIMLCVSFVRYCFLINGHEFGSLTPNGASVRGTRCPRTCFSYDLLANILGIRTVARHDLYLGLPSIVGKSQKAVFSSLRDKVWNRISGRNEKMRSHARKGMLIKAVLQSIPTYAMGVFCLSESVLRDIQSLCADFWWHDRGHRKVHWIAWDKLCARSVKGGLGFREFRAFNQAMLAKQCWRVFTNPHSLLGRLLKARYFPRSTFFDAPLSSRPSLTWRSLLSARPLMLAEFRWRVATNDPNLLVSALIDHELGTWKHDRLRDLFLPVDVEAILKIPLGRTSQPDFAVWHYSADGRFSVRSAYHLAWSMRQVGASPSAPRSWTFLWTAKVPPKEGPLMDIQDELSMLKCELLEPSWR